MLFADVSPVARPPALPGDVRFDGAGWDGPRNALNVAEEVQPWPGEGEGGGSALALLSALERRVADRLWDPEAWWRREVERNGARPCALQASALASSRGLVLFHGTGTGKTLRSLAVASALATRCSVAAPAEPPHRVLMLTGLSTAAAASAAARRDLEGCAQAARRGLFRVTHYEDPRLDEDVEAQRRTVLVVDEAHYHLRAGQVGEATKKALTKRLVEVARRARFLLLLTATPTTSGPTDFFHLLRLVNGAAVSESLPVELREAQAEAFGAWWRLVRPAFGGLFDACQGRGSGDGEAAARAAWAAVYGGETAQLEEDLDGRYARVLRRAALLTVLPFLVGRVSFLSPPGEDADRLWRFAVRLPEGFLSDARLRGEAEAWTLRVGLGAAAAQRALADFAAPAALREGAVVRLPRGLTRVGPKAALLLDVCDHGLQRGGQLWELLASEGGGSGCSSVSFPSMCAQEDARRNDAKLAALVALGGFHAQGGGKVVVYVKHHNRSEVGAALWELLAARYGDAARRVTGAEKAEERAANVAAFNGGAARILFVSDAAAHGLDLKGVAYVVLMENPRSKAIVEQIAGRGVRAGSHDGAAFSRVVCLQLFGPREDARRPGDADVDCVKSLAKLCSLEVLARHGTAAPDYVGLACGALGSAPASAHAASSKRRPA